MYEVERTWPCGDVVRASFGTSSPRRALGDVGGVRSCEYLGERGGVISSKPVDVVEDSEWK